MTDPTAQEELPPPPPAKPPRPSYPATSTTQQQLREDEIYARRLAEHFSDSQPRGRQRQGRDYDYGNEYPEERERNFFDGMFGFTTWLWSFAYWSCR
jgi:hypothetical protein